MDRRFTYILYITFIPPVVCTDPGSYKLIIRTKRKRTKNANETNERCEKRTIHERNETNELYGKRKRTIHERNERYMNERIIVDVTHVDDFLFIFP